MRKLTMFIAGFAVMLIAGIATAQLGGGSDQPADGAPLAAPVEETTSTSKALETTTTTAVKAEEPVQEPEKVTETAPQVDTEAPEIEILHPEDGQVFEHKEVVFEGRTEPGARVFAGDYEAEVHEDGSWRIVLWLDAGRNVATLKAIDAAGNTGTDSVTVVYERPEDQTDKPKDEEPKDEEPKDEKPKDEEPKEEPKEDEPKEEPAEWEFTAIQQYGSCGEEVPFDVFYGEGRPGMVVEAGSEYGSGRAVVNEKGHWEMKITFAEAPVGEEFKVVIETSDGHRKVFGFVRT